MHINEAIALSSGKQVLLIICLPVLVYLHSCSMQAVGNAWGQANLTDELGF